MTNAEYYNLTDELVEEIKKSANKRGRLLIDLEISISAFIRKFCKQHDNCKQCPFFKNEEQGFEQCFIQWLEHEVEVGK